MGSEQSQRRKRVSDGGLGQLDQGNPPARILPDASNGNSAATPSADEQYEWVLEFGGNAPADDPTARLPQGEPGRPHIHSATLSAPAQPAPQHPSLQPTQANRVSPTPPRDPNPPSYADYDYSPVHTPVLPSPSSPDRAIVERPPESARVEREPVVVVKKGPSTCAILGTTFGVIALACALLSFALIRDGFSGLGNLFGWVPNLFGPPKVSIDTTRPSVIEKVSALSRLETVHYEIEKVVEGKSSGPLWDIFTSDKILLIAHGDVVAGVDLSKLKPEDIRVMTDTNSVTIKLPKAEVFNPKTILDSSQTRVYDRSGGIIPMTDPNLETRVRQVAEEQILQAAIENGMLTKAQENAEDVVKSLVTGLGFKEVKFDTGP